MQSAQKTGEPSMEEILASIRKIIAEDPNAASAPLPTPPAAPVIAPGPVGAAAPFSAAPSAPRGQLTDLDKELADLLSEPIDVPPAARPAPASPGVDLHIPAPAPLAATPAPSSGSSSGLGTWFRSKTARTNIEPAAGPANEQPRLPALNSAEVPAQSPPITPTVDPEISIPAVASQTEPTVPAPSPLDPPAGVVGTPASIGALAASASPTSTMQSILGRLAQSSSTQPSTSAPVPGPVKSRSFQPSPHSSEPSAAGGADALGVHGSEPAPLAEIAPTATASAAEVQAAAPVCEPVSDAGANGLAGEAAPVVLAIPAMSAAANAAIAAAAAAASAHSVPAKGTEPRPDGTPVISGAASPASTAASPEPSRAEPVPVSATASGDVPVSSPVPASPSAKSTIEDTLADLMRPMVRQWLDENMQKALEKAVRTEVADSLKKASPGPGADNKG